MKYKYVLFDLDGTLTDPKIGITKSVKYALNKFNIDEPLENLEKFIGPPLKESFMEYYSFSEEKAVKAIEYYREYFKDKGIFENKLYDGIIELLELLIKQEKSVFIATSKPTVFAEKIVKYFNIEEYFNLIIGSNLDGTRTHKGDVISHLMEQIEIKSTSDCIMIGDRKFDVIGAKNNNIDSIAVTYGYGSKDELINSNPTYIVDSVFELYNILK